MCRVGGDAVCGLYQMSDEVREEGASPNWLNYVTVADVDAAAARATEAGGAVLADAFDVLDAGRMAVLEDPQGAVFAVWLPRADRSRARQRRGLSVHERACDDRHGRGHPQGARFTIFAGEVDP